MCIRDRYEEDDDFVYRPRTKIRHRPQTSRSVTAPTASLQFAAKHSPPPDDDNDTSEDELAAELTSHTPRTKHLLSIINSKDVSQIKLLKGVGAKKAEAIVNCLCDLDDDAASGSGVRVTSLGQLGKLKGVGVKTVENMRMGLGGLAL